MSGAPEVWHGVQPPPADLPAPIGERVRRRPLLADVPMPMPDLSYRDQCPTRYDFAAAIAAQIVDDALPDRAAADDDAGYSHARRNGLALMHGALHIASQVSDNYPGQDISHMVVFERWCRSKYGLRQLQRMRATQLGVHPAIRAEHVSTENA